MRDVWIGLRTGKRIAATLTVPPRARGLVIFAHGSGSGRHSPRNQSVARTLNEGAMATLLLDLLTADEERIDRESGEFRFMIPLLAQRLIDATQWAASLPAFGRVRFGYFGASTGAAAALVAAAHTGSAIGAVVSRGGRPDLAGDALAAVRAPVLLIVGGNDTEVIDLNKRAMAELAGPHQLTIVPGASHLFEEPGALEEVAMLARDWFARYLAPHQSPVG